MTHAPATNANRANGYWALGLRAGAVAVLCWLAVTPVAARAQLIVPRGLIPPPVPAAPAKRVAPEAAPATPAPPTPATEDKMLSYERSLLTNKIEPTVEGLRAYLLSLQPGEQTRRELAELVTQLGSESFAAREAAMLKLRQRSAVAMETLKMASTHADPEIRWRAKKLLENANAEGHTTFFAVFKTIEARELKGLVEPILSTLPLITKDHVRFAARRALATTATTADLPVLRKELAHADPQMRIAALGAIAAANEKGSADDALSLATDKDDQVRMAAARILSRLGRRESLALLVSLLDAPEIELRGDAGRTLKLLTGQEFGYVAYDREETRNVARDKWKVWLASDGQTAKLASLVKDTPFDFNRILVCSYGNSTVYEFDADAKDVAKPRWQLQIGQQPWGVQGLPNGHRLVAHYTGRKIMEYGPEADAKKPVWESELLPGGPMAAIRLDNGNTLVACSDANLVVEIGAGADGKIIKRWSVDGRPVDVQRLENGNTLVCLQNGSKVVEIDQEGKVQWTASVGPNPFSAQRLDNGNTLISVLSGRRVVEVAPDGKREVWSIDGLNNPYDARRLANGNTLVADQNGIYEYEPTQKKVVWKLALPHISRVSRF